MAPAREADRRNEDRMNKVDELLVFQTVAETRNFSGAARALELSPSGVSKLIARLEDRLGVLLFRRSARNVELTPEGESFYASVKHALDTIEDAEIDIARSSAAVSGLIRVFAIPTFARYRLAPLLPELRRRFPELRLDLQLTNDPLQITGTFDIAIQSGELPDSSLTAHRLTASRWIVAAAPSYLERRGTPRHPADLADHECLRFGMQTVWNNWPFQAADGTVSTWRASGALSSNQGDMLLAIARAGGGIVRLAEFHIRDALANGELVAILEDYNPPDEEPIWVLFHTKRHLSTRIRTFIDFLDEHLGSPG
jgi:DNA-binding transcriptional LysR family regulator